MFCLCLSSEIKQKITKLDDFIITRNESMGAKPSMILYQTANKYLPP